MGVAFISRFVVSPVAREMRGDERAEPAYPPVFSQDLSHALGEGLPVGSDTSLELPVCLACGGLVELQPQEKPCPQRGKQSHRGLDHDERADRHDVEQPGQHREHQARDDSEGEPSN